MKLFYRIAGEGKPIIILHGVFGSSDNWFTISKVLAEEFKVFLLDARNHGQSPRSEIFNYESMAEDLFDFIKDHNIEKPIIIGHSMGGKTVMNFAAAHPDVAEKIIIVDIAPRFYKRHHDLILEGLNAIDLESLNSRQDAEKTLSSYIPEFGVRQFLLKNLYRDEHGKFAWRMNLKVITEKIDIVGEKLETKESIKIPCLFIKGEKSGYIGPRDEEDIKQQFPNSNIVTIPDAGHWVQAEKPQEFIATVKAFIE